MSYNLFDYFNSNNENLIAKWTKTLQKNDRGKLNAKLDMLALKGTELFPHILTGTPTSGILKLRVKGNVQLRPMLCNGPINNDREFTLLIGAVERDSNLVPSEADEKANKIKSIIIKDHNRRCAHERIS